MSLPDAVLGLAWDRFDGRSAAGSRWLSQSESAHAATIVDPIARARFLTARRVARRLTTQLTGVPSPSVKFRRASSGQPLVDLPEVSVSVSRSEDLVVVAVALDAVVGVDVEPHDRQPFPPHRLWLSRREVRWLEGVTPTERQDQLVRLWTAKEAASKAVGLGSRLPFREIEIDMCDGVWREPGSRVDRSAVGWTRWVPGHVVALATGPPR